MPFSISTGVGRIVFTSAMDLAPAIGFTCLFTGSWCCDTITSLPSRLSRYSMKSRPALGAGAFFRMPEAETMSTAPSSG